VFRQLEKEAAEFEQKRRETRHEAPQQSGRTTR